MQARDCLLEAPPAEGYDCWLGRRALRDWCLESPALLSQQSTLLEPRRLLFLGMHRYGYQLSGASGTPLLADATPPALRWTSTSPNCLRASLSSFQNVQQCQRLGANRISASAGLWDRCRFSYTPPLIAPKCALGGDAKPLFVSHTGSVPILHWKSAPLHNSCRHCWSRVIFCRRSGTPHRYRGCKKWRPPLGRTGQGAVKNDSSGDLRH